MAVFINQESYAAALSYEEINVFAEVMARILSGLEQKARLCFPSGTLILDSQSYGEEAVNVWRCNLPEGPYLILDGSANNSDQLAEQCIDEMLEGPQSPHYRHFFNGQDVLPASGLYWHRELRVLVLNTDDGRFLFTACLQASANSARLETSQIVTALMRGCEEILAYLRPNDETLHAALCEPRLYGIAGRHHHRRSRDKFSSSFDCYVVKTVERVFSANNLPSIQRWRDYSCT